MQNPEFRLAVEKIPISVFTSAHLLKREIRKIIREREKAKWDLCNLVNSGPHITLHFKKENMVPDYAVDSDVFV